MQPSYADFRRKLDDVLRQRDPMALRAFLVAEGQWDPDTATDPERALWMMIATSPALADMHAEAVRWLVDHGYHEEAQALGRNAKPSERSRQSGQRQRAPRDGKSRRSGGPSKHRKPGPPRGP